MKNTSWLLAKKSARVQASWHSTIQLSLNPVPLQESTTRIGEEHILAHGQETCTGPGLVALDNTALVESSSLARKHHAHRLYLASCVVMTQFHTATAAPMNMLDCFGVIFRRISLGILRQQSDISVGSHHSSPCPCLSRWLVHQFVCLCLCCGQDVVARLS